MVHPDADPVPPGLKAKRGVEYGCGKAVCTDCYEPDTVAAFIVSLPDSWGGESMLIEAAKDHADARDIARKRWGFTRLPPRSTVAQAMEVRRK